MKSLPLFFGLIVVVLVTAISVPAFVVNPVFAENDTNEDTTNTNNNNNNDDSNTETEKKGDNKEK